MTEIDSNQHRFDYQKSLKKRDGSLINRFICVEKYINRPLAALIVKALFHTRVTPNQLTYCNFFLGMLGAFCFSLGRPVYLIIGSILVQMSAIVDCADGQMARAKGMCSSYGSHLDIFLDRIMDFCLLSSVAIGLYAVTQQVFWLVLGFLIAGLYLLQINLFYITNSYTQLKETGTTGEARALLLFLVFVFGILNRMDLIMYGMLAETLLINLVRIIHFIGLERQETEEKK